MDVNAGATVVAVSGAAIGAAAASSTDGVGAFAAFASAVSDEFEADPFSGAGRSVTEVSDGVLEQPDTQQMIDRTMENAKR